MPTTPEGSKRDDLTKFLPGEGIASIIPGDNLRLTEESEESIIAFAADIAKNGQNEAGLYRLDNQRRPHLVFGHRRLRAIRDYINPDPARFGLPGPMVFKAKFRDLTEIEAIAVAASENIQRRDFSALDRAYTASRFGGVLGWDTEQIAATLQIKVPQVGRLLELLRLPSAVIDRLKRGKMKEATARSFAGLDDEQVAARLADFDAGVKPSRVARDARKDAGKVSRLTVAEIIDGLTDSGVDQALGVVAWIQRKAGLEEARLADFAAIEGVGTETDPAPLSLPAVLARVAKWSGPDLRFACADCVAEQVGFEVCSECGSQRVMTKASVLAALGVDEGLVEVPA